MHLIVRYLPRVICVGFRADGHAVFLDPGGAADCANLIVPPDGRGEHSVADVHGEDAGRNHVRVTKQSLGQCVEEAWNLRELPVAAFNGKVDFMSSACAGYGFPESTNSPRRK